MTAGGRDKGTPTTNSSSRAIRRHNNYRIKKPGEPASVRHQTPATINIHKLKPSPAA
jgi:hypothetical protein